MRDAISIDRIFEMISQTSNEEVQKQGIREASCIKHLSVFFQPIESKMLWHNCAIIIADRSDEELAFYIIKMFEWLQDTNWPGADVIYQRLLGFPKSILQTPYHIALKMAFEGNDKIWEETLLDFWREFNTQNLENT